MQNWIDRAKAIPVLNSEWRQKARTRLNIQTRPAGSLGVLEDTIERLVAIQKTDKPEIKKKRILIFAADHGVEEEKVSLYPKSVTQSMVLNFLNGGATINALARQVGAEVQVIDVGVDADFENETRLIYAKIRRGTRNMVKEPAMTWPELEQALTIGWSLAEKAKKDGVDLLGLGEMGIANTTSASAVIAALMHAPVEQVTGRGTGLDDRALEHKIDVIEQAMELHAPFLGDIFSILQRMGGYEIAAMTGAILGAVHYEIPVVIDGWIVAASALVCTRLNLNILDYLFFAHQSEELGHRVVLEELNIHPLLNLRMRLGEGSAAALAMPVLEAGLRIYREVATFEEAKVAQAASSDQITA